MISKSKVGLGNILEVLGDLFVPNINIKIHTLSVEEIEGSPTIPGELEIDRKKYKCVANKQMSSTFERSSCIYRYEV